MVDFPFGTNIFGTDDIPGNTPGNRPIGETQSFARVVVFHYKKQTFKSVNYVGFKPGDNVIFETETVFLESELTSVSINKNLNQAAGSFEIEVLPTQNFKTKISPGDWCLIYLYNTPFDNFDPLDPPNDNIVMVGNIDRVSRSRRRNEESDKLETRFVIGGRDFGKIFEDTDIFFNPYVAGSFNSNVIKAMLVKKGIPFRGSPDTIIGKSLDVFLSDDGATLQGGAVDGKQTDPIDQWRIPGALRKVLEKGSSKSGSFSSIASQFSFNLSDSLSTPVSFGTVLKRYLTSVPGFKSLGVLTTNSNGNLWDLLKNNSNKLINELYVALDRDGTAVKPAIYLRPRPNSPFFGLDETAPYVGPLNGAYQDLNKMQETSRIEVTSKDIIYENLGKDGRSRFNMWWMNPKNVKQRSVNVLADQQAIPGLGPSLPLIDAASISRYGLSRTEGDLEFAYETADKAIVDIKTMKAFLNQYYDHHRFNHVYETGTMQISGKPVEIGKVLRVKSQDVFVNSDKIYYIEGYTHNWTFPSKWKTNLTLTRGQWVNEGVAVGRPFIDIDVGDLGREDAETVINDLIKTAISRKPGPEGGQIGGFDFPGFDF